VVPVYNAGRYLERCITSLLQQTLPADRYDVIFVDDGSTDGSGARLNALAAEHPQLVRVLHIPNSGWPGRPRNIGTDEARHKYVFYCDADDCLTENALATQLDRAEHDRSDLVVARRVGNRHTGPFAIFERGDFCTTWRETPAVFSNMTCQKLFRRSFLREQRIRFPEGRVRLEDFIFMTQAYLKAERISVIGTRPCYIFDRRDDQANITATPPDEDDYWRSVERIIEMISELTPEGPERDLALERVVCSELIATVSGRSYLAKEEGVRIRAWRHARRLLTERVPPSAVQRLDALSRQRAALILAGERLALERFAAWHAGVEARIWATDACWRDGRLVLSLQAQLERDGEVVHLTRIGERVFLPASADHASLPDDVKYPVDVTAELVHSSLHVVLRDREVHEDWRVRASLLPDAEEKNADCKLRWTATAELNPIAAAGGRPLRPAEWDFHAAVASCGWGLVRPLAVPPDMADPPPAVLGPASTIVVPFRRQRTQLSLDIGGSSHPLWAEVALHGAGPAYTEGPDLTVPLPGVVTDSEPTVEVRLRPAGRAKSPRVKHGKLVGSAQGSLLQLRLDAVPPGIAWWSLDLRLDGLHWPLGLDIAKTPLLGLRTRKTPAPPAAHQASVTWRRRGLQAAGRLGLHVADVRAGAAIISRSPYDVQPVVPDEAYIATRRRASRARVLQLGRGITFVATGKQAGAMRVEKVGELGWWVVPADVGEVRVEKVGKLGWWMVPPDVGEVRVEKVGELGWWVVPPDVGEAEVAPVTTRGWLAATPDSSPRAVTLFENDAMHLLGIRHVAWLLNRYRVDCVLDVGANVGQYALELRRNGFRGHIISFEPVPAFAEKLEKLAAGDDRWVVHRLALGSTEGIVPIHVQRTFSSLLSASEYGKKRFTTLREGALNQQILEVQLRRLDTLFDELLQGVPGDGDPPRVFLKMDTQGFDLEVFRGLGEHAQQVVGLQSEVALLSIYDQMPRMPEALEAYEAAGFEISGLYPVTSEPDGRVIEYDCVMVRASACLS
jgi:poly(ribitol-phosphate) beta-N-acetylglucosaminyltransferase